MIEDDPSNDLTMNNDSDGEATLIVQRTQDLKILDQRSLKQTDRFTIYHYCTPDTLLLILKNRTLRFSDISRLNDAQEKVWGYQEVFIECLNRIKSGRGVPVDFPTVSGTIMETLMKAWDRTNIYLQPFACCFSSEGDSLSQWRAYAADGEGFSIGLSVPQFGNMPTQLLRVEYSPETQIAEMFSSLASIIDGVSESEINENHQVFRGAMMMLVGRSIAFKNPAFRDEQEVRAVFGVYMRENDTIKSFQPTGGTIRGKPVEEKSVDFQARKHLIVPYVDWPYATSDHAKSVSSVIRGPKCKNSEDDIRTLLATLGFEGVTVTSAGAAYR